MGGRGAIVLLDGAADRDQRPERKRGVNVVCEAGYPQKGGEMSNYAISIVVFLLLIVRWVLLSKDAKNDKL